MSELSIQNLAPHDPFVDVEIGAKGGNKDELVHIRIQQRNGRKTLTTIQGINSKYDLKKIAKNCKKEFNCNGTVVDHPEYGEVIQLTGDQRDKVEKWLLETTIVKKEQLKVHGF